MNKTTAKFSPDGHADFLKELRTRVAQYFETNGISVHANFNMITKTVFMLCLYFLPLTFLLTGVVASTAMILLMWLLMSLGMSGIGLAVMHDAMHRAYSKNQHVNNILGFLINFLGANHMNWRIQHNILHHSYTNVHDMDEDLNASVFRLSPHRKRKKIHRFQAFYAPFFYGLMSIFWTFVKDFLSIVRYNKNKMLGRKGKHFKLVTAEVIFHKVWYLGLTLVLPMILAPGPWWLSLVGFFGMLFITGIILSFIFQMAHIVQETDFYKAGANGQMEHSWAVHQMKTTANFGNGSAVLTWLIGGLNYQIEHHLFPNICHIHYPKISRIVRETAKEFKLPYSEHKTFFGAVRSHFLLLHQLGTGRYDRLNHIDT